MVLCNTLILVYSVGPSEKIVKSYLYGQVSRMVKFGKPPKHRRLFPKCADPLELYREHRQPPQMQRLPFPGAHSGYVAAGPRRAHAGGIAHHLHGYSEWPAATGLKDPLSSQNELLFSIPREI